MCHLSQKKIFSNESFRRLRANFLSLTVLQIATYVLPLLTVPYLVRVLGAEKFGLVMFAQSFLMFFQIITDFGFSLSATREISIHRGQKKKITEIYSSVMIIKLVLTLVSFLILTLIIFCFDKFSTDIELYYLSFSLVIGQAFFPGWFFQGMERMKFVTLINVMSKGFFTILIFTIVHKPSDYIFVPILNGAGSIIGTIISIWIVHQYFKQQLLIQEPKTLLTYFKSSAQFFLSRISVSIYTCANAFVLGLFTNNTMVGYYSVADKLYQAIQQLYSPVTQSLYPYVSKERNINLFKKIFSVAVCINTLGVIILFVFGESLFNILFTNKIGHESLEIFHILLFAALVVVPSILIGYPFLGALGFTNAANMSVVYGSLFHVLWLSLLSLNNYISIYTVAITVVSTEILVLGIRIYHIKRNKLWVKQ